MQTSCFHESTDNSIVESLSGIISSEFCWNKFWKTNGLFYSNQIETRIQILTDEKCQVTFGFKYIFLLLPLSNVQSLREHLRVYKAVLKFSHSFFYLSILVMNFMYKLLKLCERNLNRLKNKIRFIN